MPFHQFTLKTVQTELGLDIEDGDLFLQIVEYPLSPEFIDTLNTGSTLALAVNTEKAKAEFIVAPILLEVKKILRDEVSIFSGVELDVDETRGLSGICDFIISKARKQHVLTAPLITIVESKNDNLRDGFGQCIAEMYAAQCYNQMCQNNIQQVYGIVTIGSAWKFMMLKDNTVVMNLKEYFIDQPGKIVGIIVHIVTKG